MTAALSDSIMRLKGYEYAADLTILGAQAQELPVSNTAYS